MAFPDQTYTDNESAAAALSNKASAAGLDLTGLNPIAQLQSAVANLLVSDPSTVTIPAGDVLSGTFGANKSGGADTGTYVFPSQVGFGTKVISTTALATPSALVATTGMLFASTVSGSSVMGFGTTNDVTLMNRAGTPVLGITANTTGVTMAGALAITGALSGVTSAVFSTLLSSVTALATPSALAATALNAFASTVSGATLMGFGTTGDVTLKNRAGTSVLYVGPNTTTVTTAGPLVITGAFSGATTVSATDDISTTVGRFITARTSATFSATGTTTSSRYLELTNTGSSFYAGAESSAGGSILPGSTAYAGAIASSGTVLELGGNNTLGLRLGSSGAATFFGAVSGVSTLVTTGALTVNAASQLGTAAGTDVTTIGGTAYGAGVASLRLNGLSTAAVNNQVGTLTNAPVAGNATFWMPISHAGTIRYIPCW